MELSIAADIVIAKINDLKSRLDRPLLIAFDGRSGCGKSTLAELVAKRITAAIVTGDDFYSGGDDEKWESSTPEAKADQAIDWKRLRTEVLEPLLAGKPARWHPLAFTPGIGWTGWKDDVVVVQPAPVILLDVVYSARAELADIVDVSVLIELPDALRRARLITREGPAFMARWHAIWDSAENYYFSRMPAHSFDLVIRLES